MPHNWQRLAWWWNQSWGTDTRKDVWLEFHPVEEDFRIRWRHGRDAEEARTASSTTLVIHTLKWLLGEDKSGWQEHVYLDAYGDLWRFDKPGEKVIDD